MTKSDTTTSRSKAVVDFFGWNAAIEAAERIAQENTLHGCDTGGEIYIAAKIAKEIGKLKKP